MLSDHCRRCGLRIVGNDRRDFHKKYNKHVVDEHGLPGHVRETVR